MILRRLLDVGYLSRPAFERAWMAELNRVRQLAHTNLSSRCTLTKEHDSHIEGVSRVKI